MLLLYLIESEKTILIEVPSKQKFFVENEKANDTDEKGSGSLVTFYEQHVTQCSHSQALTEWKTFVEFLLDM